MVSISLDCTGPKSHASLCPQDRFLDVVEDNAAAWCHYFQIAQEVTHQDSISRCFFDITQHHGVDLFGLRRSMIFGDNAASWC